jgi:hypothetical protein
MPELVPWWLLLEQLKLEAKAIPRPRHAAGPALLDGEVASGEREGGSVDEGV